jgi:hypothetical protein
LSEQNQKTLVPQMSLGSNLTDLGLQLNNLSDAEIQEQHVYFKLDETLNALDAAEI